MGKRILIWRKIIPSSEWDIFSPVNYKEMYQCVQNTYGGICPNWGNKLWFQALISEIDNGENTITYKNSQSIDEINNNYDIIVYPMANIFGEEHINNLLGLSEFFSKIKVPVFVIACGAQADSYDHLDKLVNTIGNNSKKFINAIYATGGEFALRGHFTKAFFDKLGFPSAVVTGCPSMYQMGRDFRISNDKVSETDIHLSFNGRIEYFIDAMEHFGNSIFMDQEIFFNLLYNHDYNLDDTFVNKLKIYKNIGIPKLSLLYDKRIKQFPNMNDWYTYLKSSGINYSFGSRIHGSIMPILAGVPATIVAIDSRTREMAEFFDIPLIVNSDKKFSASDIIEAYYNADYTKFNNTYSEKFSKYEDFLVKNKIITKINDNNKFLLGKTSDDSSYSPNYDKIVKLLNDYKKSKLLYSIALKAIKLIK